ncbi:MAG: hypothetical protein HYX34_15000 [Actinobacteria bacterium]|nr:hypothetical protein [Actinomycetota bacterium]
MPTVRTEVTEITTGLAMLGLGDLDWALAARPAELAGVTDAHWDRLAAARADAGYEPDFSTAWANGLAFLRAADGLRGRVPLRIEWKGPDKLPQVADVPADLRVDRVYLVSCKYLSKVLANLAPASLFDGPGVDGGSPRAGDWFAAVAPTELQDFFAAVRSDVGASALPALAADLDRPGRDLLKQSLARTLPPGAASAYESFVRAVGERSAARWAARLGDLAARERLLWRLLRLGGAPYFVLGSSAAGAMRLRIDTPWDWRQRYRLRAFEVWPEPAGQPVVRWQASVRDAQAGGDRTVRGHVEVRWSHGRFSGAPEAKVYLDTPHAAVPGYTELS